MAPARIVLLGISLVPEGRQLFPRLTVLENLRLGAYFYANRKFKKEIRENLDRIYTLFPVLRERAKAPARILNGREQQMVAMGRA